MTSAAETVATGTSRGYAVRRGLRSCVAQTTVPAALLIAALLLAACDRPVPTPPATPSETPFRTGELPREDAGARPDRNGYGAQPSTEGYVPTDTLISERERDRETAAPVGDTRAVSFVGVRTTMPASWSQQQPQSPMHYTSFRVPHPEVEGEPAEIVVFFFGPGQGGPIDANITRWEGQFRSPEGGSVRAQVQQTEVSGMPIVLVELQGEYQGVGDRWFTPDRGFITAIVDAPGDRRIFIRLLGETATVHANREAFMAMVESLTAE